MIARRIFVQARSHVAITRPVVRPPRTRSHPFQQQRFASYQRLPGRGPKTEYRYSNFRPFARVQYLWWNYQIPILVTGAAGGTFYVVNLEEVPVTHRRRFNCISPATEKSLGGDGYQQVLQQYQGKLLPEKHPYVQMVARVVERLLPSTGGLAGDEWVVHVINEPKEKNAFVMPGGKVFVFTGILPICQDENGLAAVLGHEIAHNVAHHTAEKISGSIFISIFALVAANLFDVSGGLSRSLFDLLLSLPNSRTQEAEADHIGLLIMAESCYDPHAAIELWHRMATMGEREPPQFISTHPNSARRAQTLQRWMPEAEQKLQASECGITSGYANAFKDAFESRQAGPPLPSGLGTSRPSTRNDDDFW